MRDLRWSAGALLAIACAVGAGCAQETSQDVAPVGTSETTTGSGMGSGSGSGTSCDAHHTCTTTVLELRDEMRRLWTDHVAYTRFYMIEAAAGLPEAPATARRLLQNQDQIGAAIAVFYGKTAGHQLAVLLRAHITGAVAVVRAAMKGDTKALAAAKAAWYRNADQIARFLANANPSLSFKAVREMMHVHLDQTLAEATARLTGDWTGDVRAFDQIVAHILDMADTLTDAIAKQFPDRVSTKPAAGDALHLTMRALWEDHVIWTRVVILSATANASTCGTALGDLDAAMTRLLRNQDDIGNAMRSLVGDRVADQLIVLLHAHITIAAEIVTAAVTHDQAKLADATARWYANADQIATLLADNLQLPVADLQEMMRTHLDETLAEATDHLASNFRQDLADYDAVVDHILKMADALSEALTQNCTH